MWLTRPPRGAAATLPGALAGRRPLGVAGGLIRYLDTPVGRYDEVFAALGFPHRRGVAGHISFMAVDSAASVAGGRGNWALPKELAGFTGDLDDMTATGEGWQVIVRARPFGVAVPLRSSAINLQEYPDGVLRSATLRLRGRARPALVEVDAGGHPALLRSGRHLGALLEDATFVLGVPRPT